MEGEKFKKPPRLLIDRNALTQELLIQQSGYKARDKSLVYALRQSCQFDIRESIKGFIPILEWLPKYSIKRNLLGDVMSGCTVAVMHIPQGMAYGILAGLTPNIGLYMAFFPVLTYLLFGKSRHISIGTFAVISMMTLKVILAHTTHEGDNLTQTTKAMVIAPATLLKDGNYSTSSPEPIPHKNVYTPLQIATATAIMTGFTHLIMGVLQLGTLANLLSESLVNGFTTGAACHVVTAQLKDILGVNITKRKGPFKLLFTLGDIAGRVQDTNLATLVFSIGIISFMILMNELVKPFLSKKTRFPFPAELIAVVGGTLISRYVGVGPNYNIRLVGEIPTGLPAPAFPPFALLYEVWFEAIVIAMVTYSIVMSMSFIFAKKHRYQISPNQELFALGFSNIVGGSFSCIPVTCSLSRSLIQEQTGGTTQIASAVSAGLILMVLLWIGPFFETLPRCVLAGVIIIALKGMFTQAKHVRRFAKEGKLEILLWFATFLGVIIIDIDYGLIIGILASILILYIKGWKSSCGLVGNIPNTEIYVLLQYHKNAIPIPYTKIFRYFGPINFATMAAYKKNLYDLLHIKIEQFQESSVQDKSIDSTDQITDQMDQGTSNAEQIELLNNFKVLILDLHAIPHIDISGCKTLAEIVNEMQLLDVKVFLVSPTGVAYDALVHSMGLGEGPFHIFPTVHDAVVYSKAWQLV